MKLLLAGHIQANHVSFKFTIEVVAAANLSGHN